MTPPPAMQIADFGRFSIHSQRDGATHAISVFGEIDIATAEDVERELLVAEATDAATIALDLGGLTFIDSSAVRILLLAGARSRADGDRLVLRNPPPCVLRVLRICGVDALLPLAEVA